jgi:elongation factor Ts
MAISAADVKKLREMTGAGMLDCKKALQEADGDFDKAIEILRKKGASVAAKRAERSANEGVVLTKIWNDGKTGAILEVNCETDFVANSDDFVNFAKEILDIVVEKRPANRDELMNLEIDGVKVADKLNDVIGKIGEKIEISRFAVVDTENGMVVDYIHHGANLGVMLKICNVTEKTDELETLMKDIAMQVAAMKPLYVKRDEVPTEAIEKEKEIYKEVARKEGKPEQILDRIAEGKLNKYFSEVCLLEQTFVKDNTKTVGQLIDEYNKAHGTNVTLEAFYRFHVADEKK